MARVPSYLRHRYRVLGPLGEGGLATAYRVWDEATEEERALKLVDGGAVELLRAEFALLAGLYHPRLVRVHDFGALRPSSDGADDLGGFYTADLLEGVALGEFARAEGWPATRRALADALEGLAFLHGLGIRHGDIKPDNVIVDRQGRGTLLDLSCASRIAEPLVRVSGTPGYVAPELSVGRVVDTRADLFSVGILLTALCPSPDAAVVRSIAALTRPDPRERPAEIADVLAALGEARAIDRLPSGRSPSLVGRGKEMRTFEDVFALLMRDAPGPRALLVSGPRGIGKSRLLAEMKWRAALTCDVAEAVVPDADQPRPDALRSLLRRAGASIDASGTLTLDTALRAADELALGPAPSVLFIDDAERLAPPELTQLEAIVRSLRDDGRVLVVTAASRPIASEAPLLVALPLQPLGPDAIRSWAGALVSDRHAGDLARMTAGHPASIESALRLLAAGRLSEAELGAVVAELEHLAPELAALEEDERRTLALVVAWGGRLARADAVDVEENLAHLAARGWTVPDEDGHRLAIPAEREAIAQALGASMGAAYGVVAREARDPATRIIACLRLGALADAERAFTEHALTERGGDAGDAQRWSDAIDALARHTRRGEVLASIGDAQLALGRAERALTAAARLLRTRPEPALLARAWSIAGAAYLHREDPARAARYLGRALAVAHAGGAGPAEQGAIVAKLARALNQTGAYAQALELGTQHQEMLPDDLDLAAALGVAATYLGRSELAAEQLARAAAGLSEERSARDAARVHSYLAILAFRAGDLAAAAAEHERALSIAERRDLADMLPTLVLNLGTARQQLGQWGESLALYERGHRIAAALGKTHGRAILELNSANLLADIGLADRASAMLARAASSVAAARISHLDGQQHTIAAEIALAGDDAALARACFERAAAVHRSRNETREAAEAYVHAALTMLQSDAAAAAVHLEEARRVLGGIAATDVASRLAVAEGRHALARGDFAAASDAIARGLAMAEGLAQPLLVAEACAALAEAKRAAHEHTQATALEERARASWERVAATLPPAMRDAFWRHPRRRPLMRPASEPSARTMDRAGGERLRRVLELGARVSSSLSLDRVLDLAMDAAIELTGAERGFLLMRDDDASSALRIAVARNVDRERLARDDLEFSTGIAEQVVRSGEPLVTLDARGDVRFRANRSVHAMRLKSVVCVPVAAQGEMLGALYLDNRFEQARFAADDVGVVLAFANHIAMAARNARLHAALEENNRRLVAEKKRVERLSRGQARQIHDLERRVLSQQRALERRYDYSAIIHRSGAMRQVLDVLDRVIDSDLTVLVEGESGTGKELVARAIHFNSSRREGPFVGVNCGALSESLLESELFGHVRGAFTGADRDREGLMAAARGGTLFLDEIGELSLAMQVKLLRALQEREVRPLGATAPIALDIRVVCATNRHLRDEVDAGRFREDLYYRLGVVELRLPPLRDRQEDIPAIASALLARHAERQRADPPEIGRDALRALVRHRWPGNVRQLENVLARAYVLSDRHTLREADLDLSAKPRQAKRPRTREEFDHGEAERIHDTLLESRWNVSRAARALGVPRNTLYRKMKRLGLSHP